ncbi:probable ribosomal protein S11, mitochondrial [Tripterygium wilfordii]|nr:probable ribosomal protein S11, mitochondrial [Tripterygium wilfordii]
MSAAALRSGTSHFLRTQFSSNATLGCLGSSRYHSYENVAKLHTSHLFGNLVRNLGTLTAKRSNVLVPYQMSFHRLNHSGGENYTETGRTSEPRDFMNGIQGTETGRTSRPMDFARGIQYTETGRTSRPMDYVRGILEEDRRGMIGASQFPRYTIEQNADFVHIKLLRNNTFVTVTDSKGNTKCRASSGCLPEMKGGTKLSRYASEATAEHVGRLAKQMGLKSVVVKVKGFTYFKKKKQAIMSFREGFANSRSDQNPIVYLEDTTRRPHNGCRLPKRRRI